MPALLILARGWHNSVIWLNTKLSQLVYMKGLILFCSIFVLKGVNNGAKKKRDTYDHRTYL
jgi:hypothetical protein